MDASLRITANGSLGTTATARAADLLDTAASPSGPAMFELHAGPLVSRELTVVSFHGTEGMSRLFTFDVVVLCDLERAVLEPMVLGMPSTLLMHMEGNGPRVVRGIVTALTFLGTRVADDTKQYSVRVAPRMWLATRRKTSRIFQDVSITSIIDTVLCRHGVATRWSVSRKLARRSYCVQYQETDYDFVTRLLAEEGLSFHFETPAGFLDSLAAAVEGAIGGVAGAVVGAVGAAAAEGMDEIVVFTDEPRAYPPIHDIDAELVGDVGAALGAGAITNALLPAPEVPYRDASGFVNDREYISKLSFRRAVRENAVTLRDYDFKHPRLSLTTGAELNPADELASQRTLGGITSGVTAIAHGGIEAAVSVGLGVAGRALSSVMEGTVGDLEVYDHHGEFEETDVDRSHARIQLQQYRADARVAEGTGTCRRLAAGHRFRLAEAEADLVDEYTVTAVTHRGVSVELVRSGDDQPVSYENVFECVPSFVAFRPPRPRRSLQQVMESAVVVGPAGEEIHTDAYGRIKVHFQWDRENPGDERSSCWIRVMHPWAGAGWGFQFIPRVGMEVLVSFLGGDEDRPVVIGSVYNGTHPTPHFLPEQKTRSGIRTESTKGGGGFNEIMFEDCAGREELYLRAQKDMRELVLNDHTVDVRANDTTRVGRDQKLEVVGNQGTTVLGSQSKRVEQSETTHIGGDRLDTVSGNVHEIVHKDLGVHVNGSEWSVVEGDAHGEVKGNATRKVAGDATTLVVGKTPCASLLHVDGTSRFTSTGVTEISSEKEVVIRCGKSVIRLLPDAIEMVAPQIRVRAPGAGIKLTEDTMEIRAKQSVALKGEGVALQSKGATVTLTETASVEASQINLGTQPSKLDSAKDDVEKVTRIVLVDDAANPVSNEHYVVLTKGGDRIGGMVGKDGKDEIYLEEGDEIVFPDLGEVKGS